MKQVLASLFALGLLALAGCAGMPKPDSGSQAWELHRAELDGLSHWTASGKIALRTAEQAESASLLWQQIGDATHVRLSGPLGVSATTVASDGQALEIRQGEDYSRWNLDDPALKQDTGFELPLRSLPHWLKGVPDPDLPLETLELDDNRQLPQQIQQEGWTVEYQQFSNFGEFLLPTRLQVYRGKTRARILLREWGDFSG